MVGRHHAFVYLHMDCPLTTLTGSIPSTSSTRPQSITPQTPRRPGPAKRAPSSKKPFRGAEFSVDDEVDEVDNDLKLVRQKTRDNIHNERASLRRRESKGTLRRRPTTAQAPTLAKVDSEEGDEEAEEAQASGVDKSTASLAGKSISQDNAEPSSEDTLQGEEEEEQGEDDDDDETPGSEDDEDDDDDADLSDAESFTLRDRQEAINETHPFGIRIWKPALYKKNRSVQRNAESDIHSAPGGRVSRWLSIFNILWVVIFGWWLAIVAAIGGVLCYFFGLLGAEGCHDYGRVLINLSSYLFYPFGKFVKLEHDEAYLEEDEGEGRSIGEYERWQTGDLEEGRLFFGPHDVNRSLIGRRREEVEDLPNETDSLLGRHDRNASGQRTDKTKKRLFGRGKWDTGRVIFFMSFYFLITPCLFFVSAICWFLVFTIPMGKVTLLLFHHLRRHPLALSFHTDSNYSRGSPGTNSHSILMCTYRAVGSKYWKYTIDGTNIFLINMLGLVAFTIFNYFVLFETLHIDNWFTSPGLNFVLGLFSIIPLAYFIGQAVASISAQSSMGVGATINAFFSTIVEVYLYCVALHQGKGQLVEGSIVGSIFAGILFLPGLSMCFGALKRKTQRFNVRSASATNTMLLFAVIGAFGPTLFYQIYGSHELNCHQCTRNGSHGPDSDCRRCYFSQTPAVHTKFYIEAVRPYTWFAAVLLFLSYIIGLLFTLRTHAAVIWNNEPDEKKDAKMEQQAHRVGERHGSLSASTTGLDHPRDHLSRNPTAGTITQGNIRDSQMYQRILSQSLKQAGLSTKAAKNLDGDDGSIKQDGQAHHIVPPKSADEDSGSIKGARIQGLSTEDNRMLVQQVAEMAATAAAVATRDATKAPHKAAHMAATRASSSYRHASGKDNESRERHGGHAHRAPNAETSSIGEVAGVVGDPAMANANAVATGSHEQASGGHDAPNWSRTKSAVILMTATVAYAVIAEILVDTVDSVLSNVDIDEKFLGITVFALVPNATEFLNAISFAMNGNIALSMEIGNSYALQVMLLQIPAVVLFTAVYSQFTDPADYADHAFTLIFPQWDMVTVILGVFLMGYVVGEGKSNYFKGSSLILTYLVFVVGFYFSGFNNLDVSDPVYLDT
jgi:Ca2+:H+ antiporter